MNRSPIVPALLLLLLVGGCSENDPGALDPDGTGDADCPAGEARNSGGQCVPSCSGGASCPTGWVCIGPTGLCVEVPEIYCDPATCAPGFVCPPHGSPEDDGFGSCVRDPSYCLADDECNFGERCNDGKCVSLAGAVVQTCQDNNECSLGMMCQYGVCVGCITDLQCRDYAPGARCQYGVCVTSELGPILDCLSATCPAGERCNPTTGMCEMTCAADSDCAAGEICAPIMQRCVTDFGCLTDADCGGLTCTTGPGFPDGVCTGCSLGGACPTGLTCVIDACLPDISGGGNCSGVDCTPDRTCDPLDGSCYPSDGSCQVDEDCRPGHTCNFLHICSGCAVDEDCRSGQRCLLGACAPL